MARELQPRSFWDFPNRLPSLLDWDEDLFSSNIPGVSISEDERNIYAEAPLPGVDPDKIDVTFNKGTLWIRAEQEERNTEKNRKFYRRGNRYYSYRIDVPGNVDENIEPGVTYHNGMVTITFAKVFEAEPRKLTVKKE